MDYRDWELYFKVFAGRNFQRLEFTSTTGDKPEGASDLNVEEESYAKEPPWHRWSVNGVRAGKYLSGNMEVTTMYKWLYIGIKIQIKTT